MAFSFGSTGGCVIGLHPLRRLTLFLRSYPISSDTTKTQRPLQSSRHSSALPECSSFYNSFYTDGMNPTQVFALQNTNRQWRCTSLRRKGKKGWMTTIACRVCLRLQAHLYFCRRVLPLFLPCMPQSNLTNNSNNDGQIHGILTLKNTIHFVVNVACLYEEKKKLNGA